MHNVHDAGNSGTMDASIAKYIDQSGIGGISAITGSYHRVDTILFGNGSTVDRWPNTHLIFASISPQERQNDISWQRVARKLKYSWSNLIAHNDYVFRVAVTVQTQWSHSKWPQCSLVVFSMHFLQAIIPISFLWQEPLSIFLLLISFLCWGNCQVK